MMAVMTLPGMAACQSADTSDARPFGVFATEGSDEGFDGALLVGALAYEAGCLLVVDDQGRSSLAFAEGTTTWDETSRRLTVDGVEYVVGDRVRAGGGSGDADLGPQACADHTLFRVGPGTLEHAD